MTNKRLGEICKILAFNRLKGVKLKGNAAFEKELAAWINEPEIVCPPIQQIPYSVPARFEDEYPETAKIMMDLFASGKVIKLYLQNSQQKMAA